MKEHISTSKFDCPSEEIASYIEGELSPVREIELEMHFAGCETCSAELNLQKKFLIALDHALESEKQIELPVNFTKVVVANAESRVSGLRRRSERFNALFVCAALFVFLMFTLGADSGKALSGFMTVFEKVGAVLAFAGHCAYDLAVGAVIIIRSLTSNLVTDSTLSTLFPGISAIGLYVVSRVMPLLNRL
ncbi:MAG: zf-HC2 domain-containing protein [Acidobacteriota bacterium]